MARVVASTLLASAFILFILFSPFRRHVAGGHGRPLGLNRRLGYKFPIPNFDPLVVKMHRLVEERRVANDEGGPVKLERRTARAVDVEGEDEYFGDDGKLNITLRLHFLFPLLDRAPRDDLVSFQELEQWNVEQARDRLAYTTTKEMQLRDKDEDKAISFNEYLPQFSKPDIEEYRMEHGEAGWWMEQFRNADVDRNGTLNFDEFSSFLHPEDSNNREIKMWLLTEKLKLMDDDLDGKLNFAEFSKHAYDSYKSYAEFEPGHGAAGVPSAVQKFDQLDMNKDKLLEVKELIPLLSYLRPGELSYAKYYTSYLIREADDNKDGYLSLDEMLNHEYTFYGTVYDEDNEEDDDDDDFHDEL